VTAAYRRAAPYLSAFRIRFIAQTQYRAAAWAGVATQFAWGILSIMLYAAFYRSGGASADAAMPWRELVGYMWLRQAFLALIALWIMDNDMMEIIVNGHLAYELARPLDVFTHWYLRLVAVRAASASMRCLPILIVAAVLPARYRLAFPAGPAAFGLFCLSMTLGVGIVTAVSMFIYIMTMRTLSSQGPRLLFGVSSEFLMGALIPVQLMPTWLQSVVNCLPYRYMMDVPFRVWTGGYAGAEAAAQIGLQAAWLAGLLLAARGWFNKAVRRAAIQGG